MAPPFQSTAGDSPLVAYRPRSPEMISIQIEGVVPSGEIEGEIEPSGEFRQSSAQKENSGEKSAEMEKSYRKMRNFFDRLDPKGFVCCMLLMSLLYGALYPWLLWRVSDHPPALFWTFSLLTCSLLFLWTSCLSVTMPVHAVFFRISYITMLAFSTTHSIGPVNGMVIMYLGMFYAAGLLGYAAAEHCQRVGIEQSADAVVARSFPNEDQRKGYQAWAVTYGLMIAVMSLAIFARMACVIFIPNATHTTLLDALELLVELPTETLVLSFFYIQYMTVFVLNEALVSLDTLCCRTTVYFGSCYVFGAILSCLMPELVGLLVIWLTTMVVVGFLGYTVAVRERYMQIQTRLKSELPTSVEFDEAYHKPGSDLIPETP